MYNLDIPLFSPTSRMYHYLYQPHEDTTICTNLMNIPLSTFNIHSVQLSTFNIYSVQLSRFKIHSVQLSTFNVHNLRPSNYRHWRFVPFAHIALSTALCTFYCPKCTILGRYFHNLNYIYTVTIYIITNLHILYRRLRFLIHLLRTRRYWFLKQSIMGEPLAIICKIVRPPNSNPAYPAIQVPEAINPGRAISNDMQNRTPT